MIVDDKPKSDICSSDRVSVVIGMSTSMEGDEVGKAVPETTGLEVPDTGLEVPSSVGESVPTIGLVVPLTGLRVPRPNGLNVGLYVGKVSWGVGEYVGVLVSSSLGGLDGDLVPSDFVGK